MVDFGERDLAIEAVERCGGVESREFGEEPRAGLLAAKDFYSRFGLRDEDVFLERFELAIAMEFQAAVLGFGGGGEDFDKDCGIDQRLARTRKSVT